jgi:hypothetical protein
MLSKAGWQPTDKIHPDMIKKLSLTAQSLSDAWAKPLSSSAEQRKLWIAELKDTNTDCGVPSDALARIPSGVPSQDLRQARLSIRSTSVRDFGDARWLPHSLPT